MPKKRQDARLNSRNARTTLKQNKEPYWRSISKGLALGYFKGAKGGTWIARHFATATGRRKTALGVADDFMDADGVNVLSFEQAQAKAHQWNRHLSALDSGEVIAGSYTVADALDHYVTEKEREKRKPQPRTRTVIESHIKPALGSIQLHKLTHGKIKAWRDDLAAAAPRRRTGYVKVETVVKTLVRGEYKDRVKLRATDVPLPQAFREINTNDPDVQRKRQATVNRILTVLKAALNFAHEERKIATKAAWEAVKPFRKVDVPRVRFISMAEVAVLVPACEPNFGKLVQGALMSGCRYGELASMMVESFDAHEGRLYVAESKSGESRYVELNDEAIAFFEAVTANRRPEEAMFHKANSKPWMKSEQKRPMDAACDATGIEGVTFHILRHTYASHAVMNGMPIAVLSEQLGHKDTRITERHYAHLSKSYKRRLIRENAPSFGFLAASMRPVLVCKAS